MILVTGANGHLGTQTIDFLLEQQPADNIAGLVRSEEKGSELRAKGIETRIGDYTDYASVVRALEGIDVVLLISSSTIEGRVEQHKNVINAAAESGVDQLFYTSMVHAGQELSPMASDHAQTESLIKDAELKYSIFRHTFYTEFLPLFMGNALESGQWAFPSNGQKMNLAFRTDMAEALANGLAHPEKHINATYEITSSQAYTLEEIADMISEASGKHIQYTDVSIADYKNTLQKIGLPDEQLGLSVMTAQTVANGALNFTHDHLEQLLGRKPAGIKAFINEWVNE